MVQQAVQSPSNTMRWLEDESMQSSCEVPLCPKKVLTETRLRLLQEIQGMQDTNEAVQVAEEEMCCGCH